METRSPTHAIYMDNHATTRVDPRVVEAMLPVYDRFYGNPSSQSHAWGAAAREAVERSRSAIANLIGACSDEIVFTSGATESNNLAIVGTASRPRARGKGAVTVNTEHPSVLAPMQRLASLGWRVVQLSVEPHPSPRAGRLDPHVLADAMDDETVIASVMMANNEIGVIQPIADLAGICRSRGVLLHCDATQAVGKIPIDVERLGVDLMSFSAHKLYGPKGVGALYRRRSRPAVRLDPQILGGKQEEGIRSGTLNVPGIVGFARALELCVEEMEAEMLRLRNLRDRLWEGLASTASPIAICGPALDANDDLGHPVRLPGNLNVHLGGVDGEALLLEMGDVALSSGAACASGDAGPSHVLLALGLSPDQARSTVRFGLGRFNTTADVERVAARVAEASHRLRALAS